MLAPRRVPPCFTASVLASYSFMKLTGPDATPVVLASPEIQRPPKGCVAQKPLPLDFGERRFDLVRGEARGIEPGHDRPHAGPADDVDRDPHLFEHLEDPDVGDPACPATAQGDTDPGPVGGGLGAPRLLP